MPCKNAGPFLKDSIESIIGQTYTHWELIICNDHSTDNSYKIISDYCLNNPKITLLNNKGQGILPALQAAYALAGGDFVTRMDADDIMPTHKLQLLIDLLTPNSNMKVATGKVQYFPIEEIQQGYKAYEGWLNSLVDSKCHWQEIYKECVIASPCWMMDRISFDQIGGFGQTYPEDYDLVWRMFMNKVEVTCSQEILHLWRDHSTRTSRNSDIYQTQTYFELKINYMLQLDIIANRQIVVWGAGRKGKELIKVLIQKNIKPIWVCKNKKKEGHIIYGIKLKTYLEIPYNESKLSVFLTVSSLDDQGDIHHFLNQNGYQRSLDYFVLA